MLEIEVLRIFMEMLTLRLKITEPLCLIHLSLITSKWVLESDLHPQILMYNNHKQICLELIRDKIREILKQM